MAEKKVERCCDELQIPEKCCYIRFGKSDDYEHSIDGVIAEKEEELSFETVRGEMFIIDFDKNDKIIGVELVNTDMKPCQNTDDGKLCVKCKGEMKRIVEDFKGTEIDAYKCQKCGESYLDPIATEKILEENKKGVK